MHGIARAAAGAAFVLGLAAGLALADLAQAESAGAARAVHLGDAPGLYVESGWRTVATRDDGTRVASKRIRGAPVPAVRITMEVAVDADRYFAVLADRERFARLASELYVHDTAVLARGRAGESPYEDVYTYLRFPAYLPVQDRQQVVRIWTLPDADAPGHHRLAWVAIPRAEYAGALRTRSRDAVYMERSTGCWELRPLPGGRTEVTYRSLSHPGGDFPDFLVAKTQEQQLPALMRAVAAEARARAERAGTSPRG